MSYDVELVYGGKVVTVPSHLEGGILAIGGNPYAEMSVTYNYGMYYFKFLHTSGLCGLSGLTGRQSIPMFEFAISHLGTDRDDNYWASTPGNAGYALKIMLDWASLHPDAVWNIT